MRGRIFLEFHHVSVLKEETVRALVTNPGGIYVDATLGGAGHARAVIERLDATARFIGIDQDADAIAAAGKRLANARCTVEIVRDNFRHLGAVLDARGAAQVDGVLFDLGVSSHQLDVAERGFSYMQDAPLDMRMDRDAPLSARAVINGYEEDELTRIFYEYGEERWARRIAKFIVSARAEAPLETTGELVRLIERAIPAAARREGGHPAKRVFQAIRIEVNQELTILEDAFGAAVEHLRPGGRLCIITFHSLEDRIAKRTLQALAKGCVCPPRLPVCACGRKPALRLLGKAQAASPEELAQNSRARSAKLRVAERM